MNVLARLFGRWHFRVLLAGLILLTVTLSSDVALAQPIPLPATIAYVVNNLSDDVSVIDTSTNMVIATIPVGDGPRRVAFSPDGSRAYVTNHLEGSVSVINTFTSTEIDVDGNPGNGITRITVGAPVGQPGEAGPFGVDVSPDGTKVYVGNERSGNMSVIDTATNTVIATIPLGTLGFSPRTPAFTPDGTQIWVGVGAGTNQIKRFAFPSNAPLLPTIPGVIGEAARLEFLPDGSFAFAQNGCGTCGNLQKISTATNTVVATLNYGTNGAFGMAISPDGSFVYAGTGGGTGGQVREVDSSTMSTTRTLSVSASPTGIAFSPDEDFLYIARAELGDVLVVRRSDLTQVTTIAVGAGPSDIAITTLAPLEVQIDIKPGSDPNCFNNDGHGVIPVAILGSTDFDATQVDPVAVKLNGQGVRVVGKGNTQAHEEDVNSDGLIDLVVQIEDTDGTYEEGDTIATLTGETFGGTPIQGEDSICIVP